MGAKGKYEAKGKSLTAEPETLTETEEPSTEELEREPTRLHQDVLESLAPVFHEFSEYPLEYDKQGSVFTFQRRVNGVPVKLEITLNEGFTVYKEGKLELESEIVPDVANSFSSIVYFLFPDLRVLPLVQAMLGEQDHDTELSVFHEGGRGGFHCQGGPDKGWIKVMLQKKEEEDEEHLVFWSHLNPKLRIAFSPFPATDFDNPLAMKEPDEVPAVISTAVLTLLFALAPSLSPLASEMQTGRSKEEFEE